MTYIADLKQGVVRQKAEMQKEICLRGVSPNLCDSISKGKCYCLKYNNHIASLKTYPILPGNWVDGWEYPESWIELEKKVNDLSKKGDADEYDYYARLKQQPIEGLMQDPFIKKHLNRIYLAMGSYKAKRLFVECFPQDSGAFNVPNSNQWLKEIFIPKEEQPIETQEEMWEEVICQLNTEVLSFELLDLADFKKAMESFSITRKQ